MRTPAGDGIDRTLLERLIADSGVHVAAEEIDAVGRSLARMRMAATLLLPLTRFDTTIEQFFRMLESDAVERAVA